MEITLYLCIALIVVLIVRGIYDDYQIMKLKEKNECLSYKIFLMALKENIEPKIEEDEDMPKT